MAELVRSAAWIEWCENCGMHGRIIAPSGVTSPYFASQEAAIFTVRTGVLLAHISEQEIHHLIAQVRESRLPKIEERVLPAVRSFVWVKNAAEIVQGAQRLEQLRSAEGAWRKLNEEDANHCTVH
ncbi:MAG: hypothetical protein HY435_03215 [Candidatus Liptonbacteria bacterium]|nr:hypothetical protein [Candidatus Liptonbacteria bacterium]